MARPPNNVPSPLLKTEAMCVMKLENLQKRVQKHLTSLEPQAYSHVKSYLSIVENS